MGEIAHDPGQQFAHDVQTIGRRQFSPGQRLDDVRDRGFGAPDVLLVSEVCADEDIFQLRNPAR